MVFFSYLVLIFYFDTRSRCNVYLLRQLHATYWLPHFLPLWSFGLVLLKTTTTTTSQTFSFTNEDWGGWWSCECLQDQRGRERTQLNFLNWLSRGKKALSSPPNCAKYSSTNGLPFHILCSFPLNWQLAYILTYGLLYLLLFTESSYLVLKLYARAEPQHNKKQVFFTILRFTMWLNILQPWPQTLIAFTLKV